MPTDRQDFAISPVLQGDSAARLGLIN
jgi:hypothetical protein